MRRYPLRKIPLKESVVIDGVSSLDYGLKLVYNSSLDTRAGRDFTSLPVPGRNGDLTIDNGRYKNVSVDYVLQNVDGFRITVPEFVDFLHSLTGYHRIEDSFHPEEYVEGKVDGIIEGVSNDGNIGYITVNVTRKPQRFLKSGESGVEVVNGQSSFQNPGIQTALPKIVCLHSAENATLTINNATMIFTTNPNQEIIIDSELQEIHTADGADYFGDITFPQSLIDGGYYPKFPKGETTITAAGFASVKVYPGWWRL